MKEYSSFRDPSGFIFRRDGILYRQINQCYAVQWDTFEKSGLAGQLTREGLLVPYQSVQIPAEDPEKAYQIIRPEEIPIISYPYEWCFGEYKDAALTTLKIARKALDCGMILKDASAYNIQFKQGKPVFIDTLSFEMYREGMPWIAYGQFCRHFLAPLLLMANVDIRLSNLMRNYIDGIPLDLTDKLLHRKGGFTAFQHIHLHALSISKHADDGNKKGSPQQIKISKFNLTAMIDGLIRAVEGINPPKIVSEWGDYYQRTNYSDAAAKNKANLVSAFLDEVKPASVWDMGANDGRYSEIAVEKGAFTAALDIDPNAVEFNYQQVKKTNKEMLPLIFDFTNPSPSIGFDNQERKTLSERQKPDCILALAVIHHMAISNNLPFAMIAEWFASMTDALLIEFVPKTDSQVQILLMTRDDIFPNYREDEFERVFTEKFGSCEKKPIEGSDRMLFLFRKK